MLEMFCELTESACDERGLQDEERDAMKWNSSPGMHCRSRRIRAEMAFDQIGQVLLQIRDGGESDDVDAGELLPQRAFIEDLRHPVRKVVGWFRSEIVVGQQKAMCMKVDRGTGSLANAFEQLQNGPRLLPEKECLIQLRAKPEFIHAHPLMPSQGSVLSRCDAPRASLRTGRVLSLFRQHHQMHAGSHGLR